MKLHEIAEHTDEQPLIMIVVNDLIDKGHIVKMHAETKDMDPDSSDWAEVRVDGISMIQGMVEANYEQKNRYGDYSFEVVHLKNPDAWVVKKQGKEWWLHEA